MSAFFHPFLSSFLSLFFTVHVFPVVYSFPVSVFCLSPLRRYVLLSFVLPSLLSSISGGSSSCLIACVLFMFSLCIFVVFLHFFRFFCRSFLCSGSGVLSSCCLPSIVCFRLCVSQSLYFCLVCLYVLDLSILLRCFSFLLFCLSVFRSEYLTSFLYSSFAFYFLHSVCFSSSLSLIIALFLSVFTSLFSFVFCLTLSVLQVFYIAGWDKASQGFIRPHKGKISANLFWFHSRRRTDPPTPWA